MFLTLTFILNVQAPNISKEQLEYVELPQAEGVVLTFEEPPSASERLRFSSKFQNKNLQIDQSTESSHSLFFIWETPQNAQKAIAICRQLAYEGLLSGNKSLKYCEPIFPLNE
ncbi:MAG: hypothetical protein OXK80_04115 [Bdellovibrionales bacterium]|nr:hypothetical protein [Bdellovibrionales bacterium]